MELIEIDGRMGEGGGSILRLSAALAIIFQKVVRITNIRANRKVPGLRAQHLMGLQALMSLSHGVLEGAKVQSTEVTFKPGRIEPATIDIKIGTAGSIGLLFQILSIAAAGCTFEEGEAIRVNVEGGATVGKWAPATSYITNVLIPHLERMGLKSKLEVTKHGFYPKGGAKATITITKTKELAGLKLDERGSITGFGGESIAANHLKRANVASRQSKAFKKNIIRDFSGVPVNVDEKYVECLNPGSGLTTWVTTDAGCIISSGSIVGERGLSSEKIGSIAARDLKNILQGNKSSTVDAFTSDQLIPFMMLSKEESIIVAPEFSKHAKTNMMVFEKFKEREHEVKHNQDGTISLSFPKI
ncbi:MAG: RNA 3'-terminal phosphate cyclase [Promethearchaeota archaeon]